MNPAAKLYKLLRTVLPIVSPVITVLALGGVFSINLATIRDFASNTAPHIWSLRAVWLVLAAVGAVFTYQSFAHRGILLTILDIDMTMTIDDAQGARVTVTRTQRIRPRRENVTGYLRSVKVSGSIPKDGFDAFIDHCPREKQSLHFEETPKGWEIIHSFDEPIPLVLWKLGLNTVTRTERFVAVDSFTGDEESYEIEVPADYRYRHVRLTVLFHTSRPLGMHTCRAIRINRAGISDVRISPVLDGPSSGGIRLEIRRPSAGDRYRLIWKRIHAAAAV